jgi:hypothetical protein
VTLFISQADPQTGWIGPPSDPGDGNAEWARWLVLFGLFQHWEYTGDGRILPAIYKHLHESYNRLANHAPLVAWSGARWQDYAWLIQCILDADPDDNNGEKQFLTAHLWLVSAQQEVVWEEWFEPEFFPLGNTPWNFSSHGVNTGEGLKSGAILYRMTSSPFARSSSESRVDLLERYHGAPTGIFQADETLSDSMPSHGTELCAVVESMLSLNVMHEILGDANYADRAERIAYNALPGTWSSDMWGKSYERVRVHVLYFPHTSLTSLLNSSFSSFLSSCLPHARTYIRTHLHSFRFFYSSPPNSSSISTTGECRQLSTPGRSYLACRWA